MQDDPVAAVGAALARIAPGDPDLTLGCLWVA